jgi:hypothetical protein
MTTSTGSRRLSYPWTALLVAALCAPGCGDDHADLTGFDVNLCAGNWRVVHSPRQDAVTLPPRDLAWHGGLLYSLEPLSAGPPFFSVSPADGNRSTLPVPERDIWSYWLEDDRLIYVVGQRTMTGSTPQASLSLFAWPLAGGAAEKLFDASVWASQFIPRLGGMALDREAFHWTEMAATPAGGREWTLWRNPRTGGDAVRLAVVGRPKDDLTGFDGLLPLDDRIIAYSSRLVDGMAWAIPRAGGEARPLPSWPGANIVGAGSDGALLWQRSLDTFNGQRGSDHYEVGLLRPDAAAVEPHWTGKPPAAYVRAAWSDGRGGWFVSTGEWGGDQARHTTIWAVDAAGEGRRLACDPEIDRQITTGAATPDAFYGIAVYSNLYWQLVEIADTRPDR